MPLTARSARRRITGLLALLVLAMSAAFTASTLAGSGPAVALLGRASAASTSGLVGDQAPTGAKMPHLAGARAWQSSGPDDLEFRWPLEVRGSLPGIAVRAAKVNFIDHNSAFPGAISDYQLGNRSYDTASGYNHTGTDLTLWPAPWQAMDAEIMAVVAAADGEIVAKEDGNFDRQCSFNDDQANLVWLRHDNGWYTLYMHLKSGSVTSARVGDRVRAGDQLGLVGSSGSSTHPHLHFEVRDDRNRVIDPWEGRGNRDIDDSMWIEQPAYFETHIMEVMTGDQPPAVPNCRAADFHRTNRFERGETVYMSVYPTEIPAGSDLHWTMRRPDASVHSTAHTTVGQNFGFGWWWAGRTVGPAEPEGLWTYQIDLGDESATGTFVVGPARMCKGWAVTVDLNVGQTPTSGDDVILGTRGDDVINALGGDDVVCAGPGDDVVRGGPGRDEIHGQRGADRIHGGGGADILRGNSGDDRVKGNGGPDRIIGGSSGDVLLGNKGPDTISGNSGRDTIRGNSGDDTISGGKGRDACRGGSGADIFISCET